MGSTARQSAAGPTRSAAGREMERARGEVRESNDSGLELLIERQPLRGRGHCKELAATLLEIGSVSCQKSEGRLRSESCHKRALARSAEWTESLPRGVRIAEVARVAVSRVGVVQRGPYVVRVAGKTTQRGHVLPCVDGGGMCRLAPEILPGSRGRVSSCTSCVAWHQNTAEKQRVCVAMYVVCRLAPRIPPRNGGRVSPGRKGRV